MKTLKHRVGCIHCGRTEDLLDLDTVLYYGFGGYQVQKDGKVIYQGDHDGEWETFKQLKEFDEMAEKEKGEWQVILNSPLRGATWERKEKGRWVLIETNQGFA